MVSLRDSVSSWIVSGTDEYSTESYIAPPPANPNPPTVTHANEQPLELKTDFPIDSLPVWQEPFSGKKRTSSLNFSLDKLTVVPAQVFPFEHVFGTIRRELKPHQPDTFSPPTPKLEPEDISPPLKRQKLEVQQEIVEQGFCLPPREVPLTQPAPEPYHMPYVPPQSVKIDYVIQFGKRANGNQRWELGCLAPPKIGKMRRITFELNSEPNSIPLTITAKCKDKNPGEHLGKLVLCNNDRCCEKKKIEGSRKSITECDQRLSELSVTVNLSEGHCVVEFYLKPEWNGLGNNKLRPRFDISIELTDERNGNTFCLLSWDTELQSHKFESSTKGKSMEANPITTRSDSITL